MKAFKVTIHEDLLEEWCDECGRKPTLQYLIQSEHTMKANTHICKLCFKTFVLSLVALL